VPFRSAGLDVGAPSENLGKPMGKHGEKRMNMGKKRGKIWENTASKMMQVK
jgi:hypothetical protein